MKMPFTPFCHVVPTRWVFTVPLLTSFPVLRKDKSTTEAMSTWRETKQHDTRLAQPLERLCFTKLII